MLRVVIADDDDMVRRALRDYLQVAPDISVVAVCDDGTQVVEYLREHPVDVVLMDIHMPGMDGVSATAVIHEEHPAVKVIALTCFDGDDELERALAAGASGLLLKRIPPETLVDLVRVVRQDVVVMSEDVARRLHHNVRPRRRTAAAPELNGYERKIMAHLCQGLSNAEIGREMFMSESTVKGHVTTVLRKLGVSSRLRAVVLAHELGLDEE